jgi:hypothetical protein
MAERSPKPLAERLRPEDGPLAVVSPGVRAHSRVTMKPKPVTILQKEEQPGARVQPALPA